MTNARRTSSATQEVSATNSRTFRTFLMMQQFAAQEVGQRIAQARKEAGGMTQEELADALDVSKRSLQDYEAGVTIPWKHFTRITQITGRQLDWFLRGEDEQAATPHQDESSPPDLRQVLAAVEALRADLGDLRRIVESQNAPPGQARQGARRAAQE